MPEEIKVEDAKIGDRICYRVPERGGFGLGFGDLKKINRKTFLLDEKKHNDGEVLVSKSLAYKALRFTE